MEEISFRKLNQIFLLRNIEKIIGKFFSFKIIGSIMKEIRMTFRKSRGFETMERNFFLMGEKRISKFYMKFERTSRRNQRNFLTKKTSFNFHKNPRNFFELISEGKRDEIKDVLIH